MRNVGNDVTIGDVVAQSHIIHFNRQYHVVLCYTTRGPENGFTYTHNIEHLQFGAGPGNPVVKNIASLNYAQRANIKPTLCLYRNKVIALWSSNPAGNIGIARWDFLDPAGPWLQETKLQLPGTIHTIAATAFKKIPFSYLNDYGNDLFIAATSGQGVISFENFSRSLSKALCNEQFQLDTAESETSPRVEVDLLQDKGPVISELGYNLFIFPDWFINNMYKKVAENYCNTSWAPCTTRKLPVIVTPHGNLFFARGIWINRQSDYSNVFEELGHYMALLMGLTTDNGTPPPPPPPSLKNAEDTKVPLEELKKAFAIFEENLGAESFEGRIAGFLNVANRNYDRGGREHSFLYAAYYYSFKAAEFRQYIQEDLARGNDLLKRKYDWIKKNIFRGIEFKGEQEPL